MNTAEYVKPEYSKKTKKKHGILFLQKTVILCKIVLSSSDYQHLMDKISSSLNKKQREGSIYTCTKAEHLTFIFKGFI